jgi:hypothetical protein
MCSDCIKDVDLMLDNELCFHFYVDFVYSEIVRTLGLIRYITHNFFPLDDLVVLYTVLIRSKLDYASVIWDNITVVDPNGTENLTACGFFFAFYIIVV